MGKQTESTAINNLINIVATQGPSVKDPGNDLFSSPPKGSQPNVFGSNMRPTARGTQLNIAGAPPPPPVRMSTVIPSRATTIPPVPRTASSPSIAVSSTLQGAQPERVSRPPLPPPPRRSVEMPVVAPVPVEAAAVAPTPAIALLTTPHAHVDLTGQRVFTEDRVEHTSRMRSPRVATNKDLLKRLALPALAVIVLGGSIGGYLAMSGTDPVTTAPVEAKSESAPSETAAPVAVAAIAPAITTAPPAPETQPVLAHPELVDIRIDSTPSNATVTLIDRGNSMFLGTTPISAAVDPSRTYEIVFSFASGPTRTEKLDPRTTKRLAVVLDNPAKPAAKSEVVAAKAEVVAAKSEVAAAPLTKTVARPEKKVARVEKAVIIEPDFELPAAAPKVVKVSEKVAEKVERPTAKAEVLEGVLMISSKPPCEIVVNGKPTGLMTPQRAMKLPVGKHKITLINQDKDLQMTVPVEITADKPTKVIQNLLGD